MSICMLRGKFCRVIRLPCSNQHHVDSKFYLFLVSVIFKGFCYKEMTVCWLHISPLGQTCPRDLLEFI